MTSLLATSIYADAYGWLFPAAATLAGVATGIALGAGMHRLLSGKLKRWPIALLLLFGPLIGALWGGLVALLATPALPWGGDGLAVVAAGFAGAAQLGWFWFPYTMLRIRGRGAWVVVLLAMVAGPLLGYLGTHAAFGVAGLGRIM